MIDISSEVTIRPAIVATEVDGAVTIFNPATDRYYTLERVGAAVWRMLEGDVPLTEIRERLLERYETTATTCEQDLLALLEQLREAGLVEVRDRSAADGA